MKKNSHSRCWRNLLFQHVKIEYNITLTDNQNNETIMDNFMLSKNTKYKELWAVKDGELFRQF